jgi:hypothetical protein
MKDGEIAKVVNELRDIATQYHATQQLRERIANVVVPLLSQAAPVAASTEPNLGEPIGYFLNCAADGAKPHYMPIDEGHKDNPDVIALYAAPVTAAEIRRKALREAERACARVAAEGNTETETALLCLDAIRALAANEPKP